jgi:hypothetical protein
MPNTHVFPVTATLKVAFTVEATNAADAAIQGDALIQNLCRHPVPQMATAMIQAKNLEITEVHP